MSHPIHPRSTLARRLAAAVIISQCRTAAAQPADPQGPDKSTYSLLNPTPRTQMREMSTDRPDTTESPYTVDAGHFQLELSFADFTYTHRDDAGQAHHALAIAPMLLKVGLLNTVDLQLGLNPYTRDRATGPAPGPPTVTTAQGFGDTIMRLKINIWGDDGGRPAFAIMPFVKFPTAGDSLGNGRPEGGLILPIAVSLPADFDLGAMAEIDWSRSAANDRYVLDFVHTATLGHPIVRGLNAYIEYAGFANLSHDEPYRAYFDAGLTFALTPDIQLDTGLRIGLTPAAADLGVFVGMSVRF